MQGVDINLADPSTAVCMFCVSKYHSLRISRHSLHVPYCNKKRIWHSWMAEQLKSVVGTFFWHSTKASFRHELCMQTFYLCIIYHYRCTIRKPRPSHPQIINEAIVVMATVKTTGSVGNRTERPFNNSLRNTNSLTGDWYAWNSHKKL